MLLDEPTAVLGVRESRSVLDLGRPGAVNGQGVEVVMVSHVMPHVSALADRVDVLRHGRKVAEISGGISTDELVSLMTGEPV